VLSAHVNYWTDRTVISLLEAAQASAKPVRAVQDSFRAPIPKLSDDGSAMPGAAGLSSHMIAAIAQLSPLALGAVFLWTLASLWNAAGRVDQKLADVQEFFAGRGNQVSSIIASTRIAGQSENLDGVPFGARTEIFFVPAGARDEVIVQPKKSGIFTGEACLITMAQSNASRRCAGGRYSRPSI
jgi:hypothetical protein